MVKGLEEMKMDLNVPDELMNTPNADNIENSIIPKDDKDVDQQTRYHCNGCKEKFGTWISSACKHLMCENCIRHPKCVCNVDIKDRFPVKYADEM